MHTTMAAPLMAALCQSPTFVTTVTADVTKMTMNTIPVKAANANRAKEKIVLTS